MVDGEQPWSIHWYLTSTILDNKSVCMCCAPNDAMEIDRNATAVSHMPNRIKVKK